MVSDPTLEDFPEQYLKSSEMFWKGVKQVVCLMNLHL